MKKALPFIFLLLVNVLNAQCYTKVVSAENTIIALKTDGSLWARGQNLSGTVGNGNTTAVSAFTQIGTDTDWTETIDINSTNVLAIKTNGTLWAWGKVLGPTPSTPFQIGTDNDWVRIAGTGVHYLAVKSDGTLWSWGYNQGGTLGTNNTDDGYREPNPAQVGIETNWQNVYTASDICVAIKTDGTLWSWGASGDNLGYPNANLNNAYRSPHQIGTDNEWVTISVGSNGITNGIKTNGSLWAWGRTTNAYQFGNGIASYSSVLPILIGTDTDWKDVSVASNTTMALKTNGTRWGWGENSAYQLGMGPGINNDIGVPTQCDSNSDWKHLFIDKSSGYGDGIKEDNSLYHWSCVFPCITIYPSPTLWSTACILAIDDFEVNAFNTTPNPAKNKITVQFYEDDLDDLEVTILNELAQPILNPTKMKLESNNEFELDISSLKSGIYIIIFKTDKKTYHNKIIKQ